MNFVNCFEDLRFNGLSGIMDFQVLKNQDHSSYVGKKDNILVRVYNCSDEHSEGELQCQHNIKCILETDLLENVQESLGFNEDNIVFKISPWTLKTYKIYFHEV